MNPSGTSSEPPEEPYLRSEPSVLSPASPKPLLFPQPTNIPVLEMQMDVGFNQTEVHMSDPSTRNTELRPDAWRDPDEMPSPSTDQAVHAPITSADSQPLPLSSEAAPIPVANAATTDAPHKDVPNDFTAAHLAASESLTNMPDPSSAVSLPLPLPGVLSPHPTPSIHTPQASDAPRDTPLQPQAPQTPSTAHVQSLLDNLQTSLSAEAVPNPFPAAVGPNATVTSALPTIESNDHKASASDDNGDAAQAGLMAGLPPRPPPQEQALIHPNYAQTNIRDYHPHATNGGDSATASNTYSKESLDAATKVLAPGDFAPPLTSSRGRALATNSPLSPDDTPWGPDIQSKYDAFLTAERDYVNEARWEQFPAGSRLFIGNLSSDRVTKRDIFHVFHHYGPLAQISIKQAYGFVQFLKKEDCDRALAAEQGRQIREKRVHLEVSKPQKSKGGGNAQSRRSRSPESGARGGRGAIDRYASGRNSSDRNGNHRDEYRSRGGYQRSPSPRGYRDRHDDRNGGYNRNSGGHRQRSRSPPYSARGGDEDRYSSFYSRSPPPPRGSRARNEDEDDLPLPRRDARDVPDVQILVHGELQRDFLSWVEGGFTAKGLRVGTLRLAPQLSEEAVVRRQVLEGVVAVVKLRRVNQDSGRIGLVVFKRDGARRKDVRFEEYDNLEPAIAAELVIREKGSARPQQPQYSAPPFGYSAVGSPTTGSTPFAPSSFAPAGFPPGPPPPQAYSYPGQTQAYGYPPAIPAPPTAPPYGAPNAQFPSAPPPNLANLNQTDLQSLLRTLGQPSGSSQPPYQQQPSAAQVPPMPGAYGAPGGYPAAYNGVGVPSAPPPQSQASAPNMQDILARLGTYGSRG